MTFTNIFLIFALQYKKYNKWCTVKTNLSIQNMVVKLEWQQSFPNSRVTEFCIKTDNTIYFPVNLCEIFFSIVTDSVTFKITKCRKPHAC